jgi:hypothetical protein
VVAALQSRRRRPATSWEASRDVVRPLIRIADENDPMTRLARALLTMNDYIHEDPERLETLANIAAFALLAAVAARGGRRHLGAGIVFHTDQREQLCWSAARRRGWLFGLSGSREVRRSGPGQAGHARGRPAARAAR